MTRSRIIFAAALVLCGFAVSPAHGRELQCSYTLAQYNAVIAHLEAEAAKARTLAARNPLYESDVAYYASVLRDAKQCVQNLAPVTTASR